MPWISIYPHSAISRARRWAWRARVSMSRSSVSCISSATTICPVLGISSQNSSRDVVDLRCVSCWRSDIPAARALPRERRHSRKNRYAWLPYMRGEPNDHRMWSDFAERLLAGGKNCLQKKSGNDFPNYTAGLDALESAQLASKTWSCRKAVPRRGLRECSIRANRPGHPVSVSTRNHHRPRGRRRPCRSSLPERRSIGRASARSAGPSAQASRRRRFQAGCARQRRSPSRVYGQQPMFAALPGELVLR
jgi:hypothetical protein